MQLGMRLRTPVRGHQLDLLGVYEGALHAQHAGAAGRPEEHVALTQQRLCAALVEDHARVGL